MLVASGVNKPFEILHPSLPAHSVDVRRLQIKGLLFFCLFPIYLHLFRLSNRWILNLLDNKTIAMY